MTNLHDSQMGGGKEGAEWRGEGPKQTVFFSHHSAQFDSGAVQGSTPAGPSLYSNWASIIASLTCHVPV